jgi:hypothetical protein
VRVHGFERVSASGDVLGAQADGDYARWAGVEERLTKRALRRSIARDLVHAPWIEALYALRAPSGFG